MVFRWVGSAVEAEGGLAALLGHSPAHVFLVLLHELPHFPALPLILLQLLLAADPLELALVLLFHLG